LFNYRLVLENEMEIEEKPNGGRETGNNWRKTWQILTVLSVFVDRQIPKTRTKPSS
jgi:hypothetical protein